MRSAKGARALREPGEVSRASCRTGDRGSVSAELALALPAVVLALLLGAGALGAASRQVALQDASADAARVLGRGEGHAAAASVVHAAVSGAKASSSLTDDLACVTASLEVSVGPLIRIPLRASSCALAGGL
ncbi:MULTISPECIES: TadE family type IV pilus minor pilin [unclassified Microbacterium]|uniref:TadE family type IV pilus minor pilin n=1 Tax=unclassified Microbacterium TaxID=2609290 RepID=UPI0021584283|nr:MULTISPECIES: TadE family type IV pilus minor pilin [unclassified Microbacterium]